MILMFDGGDSRGIRGGFAGDSRGIRRLLGGFALFSKTLGPTFWGGFARDNCGLFIILKRERKFGVWVPLVFGMRRLRPGPSF